MAQIVCCECVDVNNGVVIVDKYHLVSVIYVHPFGLQESAAHYDNLHVQYSKFLRDIKFPLGIIVRQVNTGQSFVRLLSPPEQQNERATLDEFRVWLNLLQQSYIRPRTLCYVVVHLFMSANVMRDQEARAHAFQLIQLRSAYCVQRLCAIALGHKQLRARLLTQDELKNLIASYNTESLFLPDGQYGRYYTAAELLQLWGGKHEAAAG